MKTCCIFESDADLIRTVDFDDLIPVKVLRFDDNKTHILYECRKCGACIFFKHEEISDFLSDDDYEDFYETMVPVADEEEALRVEEGSPLAVSLSSRPVLSRSWSTRIKNSDCWVLKL